jgi:hypothetical protein
MGIKYFTRQGGAWPGLAVHGKAYFKIIIKVIIVKNSNI